jgi:hypothetical protein
LLDPMEDGIQNALTIFQIYSLQEHKLTLFLIIAWYIWRARNMTSGSRGSNGLTTKSYMQPHPI